MKRFALILLGVLFLTALCYGYPRTVLFEEFTNTSCGPCASSHVWLNPLLTGLGTTAVSPVFIHTNWPGSTDPWYVANPADNQARWTYYGVNAVPCHTIDGDTFLYRGSQATVTAALNARLLVESPIWLKLTPSVTDSVRLSVKAVANQAIAANHVIRFYLVENFEHWLTAAPNGEVDFHYPMVDMAPTPTGIGFTHSGIITDTLTFEVAFPFRTTGTQPYTLDNCGLIAFVQNTTTKEILQTGYRNLTSFIHPVGGEVLYVGNTDTIRWNQAAFDATVNVELNRNYPEGTWETIASAIQNTGSTVWQISGPASTAARLRITSVGNPDNSELLLSNITLAVPTSITITPNPVSTTVPTGDTLVVPMSVSNTGTFDFIGSIVSTTGTGGYQIAETGDPNGPPAEWIDTTGSVTGAMGNDVTTGPYTLPFAFPFFGRTYTQFWMCSNGWITFNQTAQVDWRNAALPSANFQTMIALFWDDLVVAADTGRTTILNDTENHRVVISFVNARRWISTATHIYAQVALYEDGNMQFNYGTVTTTDFTTTIGIQSEDRSAFYTFYNNVQIPSNNSIGCDYDVRWARPSVSTFSLPAGQTTNLNALFDARLLSAGTVKNGVWRFEGNIVAVSVPVSLEVTSSDVIEPTTIPTEFALTAVYPNPFNSQLSIRYALHNATNVRIALYNVNGQEVYSNLYGDMAAGFHTAHIDAAQLATGSYFLKVEAGKNHAIKKVVLLK
ncbi:MAG: T9SS type A sorting domain-containing protein [bacterium]|nr:T9SS type A sorting domain-containing protein [bacterium]